MRIRKVTLGAATTLLWLWCAFLMSNGKKRHAGSEPRHDSKEYWRERYHDLAARVKVTAACDQSGLPDYALCELSIPFRSSRDGTTQSYHEVLIDQLFEFDNYEAHLQHMHQDAPKLFGLISDLILNQTNAFNNALRKGASPNEAKESQQRYTSRRATQASYVLDIIARQRNQDTLPFMIVAKSMIAYFRHVPRKIWDIEVATRSYISKQTTKKLLDTMMTRPVPTRIKTPNTRMCQAVYDNCDYFLRITMRQADHVSEFLNTINITELPFEHDEFPFDQAQWGE